MVSILTSLIAILAAGQPQVALAAEQSYCDDFASYSCSDRPSADVSGFVKSDSQILSLQSSYENKIRSQLILKWQKTLDDPLHIDFRKKAFEAFGLSDSADCVRCSETVSSGVADLNLKLRLNGSMSDNANAPHASFRGLSEISSSEEFKSVNSEILKQMQSELKNSAEEPKISGLFDHVKSLLLKKIDSLDIPEAGKSQMRTRLNRMKFVGFDCAVELRDEKAPAIPTLFIPNAFSYPSQGRFKVCSGSLLRSTSLFSYANMIAHELSHGFDPCNISSDFKSSPFTYKPSVDLKTTEKQFPLGSVLSCMREPDSVGAQRKETAENKLPAAIRKDKDNPSWVQLLTSALGDPNNSPFCSSDQINESFADWMAVEVLPAYVQSNYKLTHEQAREAYANVYRDLCHADRKEAFHNNFQHPRAETRINKILMANPEVRTQMGCPAKSSKVKYCDSRSQQQILRPAKRNKRQGSVD